MSLKAALFDSDGVLMIGGMFSQNLVRDFGLPIEVLTPFFKTEFKDCLVGKVDLKTCIQKYLEPLGWKGSVDELLDYWFRFHHFAPIAPVGLQLRLEPHQLHHGR
jgi:putative hydrolase of the HAD superfamily